MNRYWKVISIATIVVLTIGTFYIQSSLAKTNYPNFFIETISGEKEMLKNLTVIGDYKEKGKEGAMGHISKDETFYLPNQFSYMDMLTGAYVGEKLMELQKKYRNFMRGKEMESSIAENDEDLVYADISMDWSPEFRIRNAKFEVDVLQKDSKQQSSFSAPIPLEGNIDHLYLSHVEIFGDTLQIIVDSTTDEGDRFVNHLHVYRLDIASGKLLSGQKIEFQTQENDWNSSMYPIVDRSEDSPSKHIIFMFNTYDEVEVMDEDYDHEKVSQELVVYHLETDKQERIELPEEVDLDFNVDSLIEDTIYLTKELADEYHVIGYNIESKQIETDYVVDLNQGPKDEKVTAYVQDDYISIVSPLKSTLVDAIIKVGDVKTGDILYEGSIEIDPEERVKDYELEISHINMD